MTRKINSEVQFGAKAQPMVPPRNTVKVHNRTGFRPIVSLSGLKTRGPMQYPIRKMAVGRTFCPLPDSPKSCRMVGTALLGSEDEMPLFSTTMRETTALYSFLF